MAGRREGQESYLVPQVYEEDTESTGTPDEIHLILYEPKKASTTPSAYYVSYFKFRDLASEGSDTSSVIMGLGVLSALLGTFERDVTDRLEGVEQRLDKLERRFSSQPVIPRTDIQRPPRAEIKQMVKTYVDTHGSFWPDEFALDNNLSVWDVLDAIEELASEGYLEEKSKDDVPRRSG